MHSQGTYPLWPKPGVSSSSASSFSAREPTCPCRRSTRRSSASKWTRWREQQLVVEVDGHEAHAYPAAAERDRDRELRLRSSGYRVQRYTWRQVTERPEAVIGELRRELGL